MPWPRITPGLAMISVLDLLKLYPLILIFFYVGQALWPQEILLWPDILDKIFGRKTTLLETLGLILPLFHNRDFICGRHVVLMVDNLATVWVYTKGRSKHDKHTSIILTALTTVTSALNCKLYVQHCPHLSLKPAVLADLLSHTNQKDLTLWRNIMIKFNLVGLHH